MLIDKNCILTLVELDKQISGNGYQIIEKSEILEQLPELDLAALNIAIAELATGQYLKMKFNDEDEFCVAITELGTQSAMQLEKMRLKEMSHKVVVGKNSAGEMVVTTRDDSPVYEENTDLPAVIPETSEMMAVVKKKPMGRIAAFFCGLSGGVLGSGLVTGLMFLLSHLGVFV